MVLRNRQRSETIFERVRCVLDPSGLVPFGWFAAEEGRPGLLIGNIGAGHWHAFAAWRRAHPVADPLDTWTRAVVDPLAGTLRAEARYPFGATLWPFQGYAAEAAGMRRSPLGLLIHSKYGLWTAFRAALIFDEGFNFKVAKEMESPCESCVGKPCLSACPVDAFEVESYDVKACRSYLATPSGQRCMQGGCRARLACPVGAAFAYEADQQRFHMSAFAG